MVLVSPRLVLLDEVSRPVQRAPLTATCQRGIPMGLTGLTGLKRGMAGRTSSPYARYAPRVTQAAMKSTKRRKPPSGSKSQKTGLRPDWRLQLYFMKLESLVIPDQPAAVNTFPGLVHTARHTTKACCTTSSWANPQGRQVPKVWLVIGVKS